MARILSQTVIRGSPTLIRDRLSLSHHLFAARSPLLPPSSRLVNHRGRSGRPEDPRDLEAEAAAAAPEPEPEVTLGMRRLEDAIHGIIVRRSAPDWLPFIPGSSYWVPPGKGALGLVQLVRMANPMTEEEALSFTTARGWPSSAYFREGVSPHPVNNKPGNTKAQSDDEES